MSVAVPFPSTPPPGFDWLDDEPEFDAGRHLAIEAPTDIVMLADLGYDGAEIERKATPVAASAPFRVLSDEGAAIMLDVARRLRPHASRAADRIEHVVRGGCYRSRWLRDLCLSPEVSDAMATVYGVAVAPHAMPHHLGHLNFEPSDWTEPVDKWHHDTLPLDYVMMVTDPTTVPGGRFEWFRGTKHEMAAMAAEGRTPPRDRVEVPDFPGAGWAIALHGDMVIHRGAALDGPGERITMVNGYLALDPGTDEQSRTRDLLGVDPPAALYAEWAKFAAWRSAGRLRRLIDELEFTDDHHHVRAALADAVAEVNQTIAEMDPDAPSDAHHYEKD